MNRLLLLLLMLLVVLSPLPLGSNREWSWTLCAALASALTLLWAVSWALRRGWRLGEATRFVHPTIPLLFLLACAWALIQGSAAVPDGWKHPIWQQAAGVLGVELPGMISLARASGISARPNWT